MPPSTPLRRALAIVACLASVPGAAQVAGAGAETPTLPKAASPGALPPSPGSSAFCLFELPQEDNGRRRFINLGIVQYSEIVGSELRVYYGGGNLGSGHEARIVLGGAGEAAAFIDKMRRAAATCAGGKSAGEGQK